MKFATYTLLVIGFTPTPSGVSPTVIIEVTVWAYDGAVVISSAAEKMRHAYNIKMVSSLRTTHFCNKQAWRQDIYK